MLNILFRSEVTSSSSRFSTSHQYYIFGGGEAQYYGVTLSASNRSWGSITSSKITSSTRRRQLLCSRHLPVVMHSNAPTNKVEGVSTVMDLRLHWNLLGCLEGQPTDAVGAKTTVGIPSDCKVFSTSKHQGSKSWSNRWIITYGILFIVHCAQSEHHTRRATNLCPHGFRQSLNGGSWNCRPQSCSNSSSAGRAGHHSSTGVVMSRERSSPSYMGHNLSPCKVSVMLYEAYWQT